MDPRAMALDLNHGSGLVYGRAADAAEPARRADQPPRRRRARGRTRRPAPARLSRREPHRRALRAPPGLRGHPYSPRSRQGDRGPEPAHLRGGHVFEDLVIRWLRRAGFDLRTQSREGGQFGFETAGGRIRGHVDGVIVGGPPVGLAWPALWEHKALKASSWSDTVKKGVRLSKPVYYGQMQIYMAYMGLGSALFTTLNKDTCELHHEHVPFDAAAAQALSDKAVDVLRAADAGELPPRIASHPDFFLCRFCPFSARCWETDQ